MAEKRKVNKVLMGKPEGKKPLGRQRRSWDDGIRMDLRLEWLGGGSVVKVAQGKDWWRGVVNTVMNLLVS
jgi:hypothetical protein